jgi:hypothetical protein
MKTLLLLLFLTASSESLISQNISSGLITIKDELPASSKGIYQFEEFKEGKVYFKNGKHTRAKLNYNYLHGEVEFIHANRDTLLLTHKEFVDHIMIGEHVFYSQLKSGEMEVVGNFDKVILARKKHLVIKGNSKNMSDRKLTASDESPIPSSLLISNQSGEFQWQNNTSKPEYKYKTTYYLIDQNRIFHPANRSGFAKIYSGEQRVLSDYVKRNNINFNNEDQLKQLLEFCSGM